ncbi:MAG: hypothetical protein JOZ80_00905 [Acidobacteriaceae bacterium]|nr:hypothetical protein [Acidobacteriaceae bacterium]
MKNQTLTKLSGCLLSVVLSSMPPLSWAQQTTTSSSPETQNQPQQVEPPVPGQPTLPPVNPEQLPSNPVPNQTQTAPAQPATPAPQKPNEPSGTAAAEAERPVGNAASRPAGAAIAPAKQRQVRSLLIKLGFIAGAGVAAGTVYALSNASPGRVPHSAAATTH